MRNPTASSPSKQAHTKARNDAQKVFPKQRNPSDYLRFLYGDSQVRTLRPTCDLA